MNAHDVPNHLDVEDRLLLNLTVRQALFVVFGASFGYFVWQGLGHFNLPMVIHIGLSFMTPLLAFVFAVMSPAGRSLEFWAIAALRYWALPHVFVWRPRPDHVTSEDAAEPP